MLVLPRGLNWHFLAYEWSYAEIHTRLSLRAWLLFPQWFDDGLAVAISEAREHSEAHWQYLVYSDIPRPPREELPKKMGRIRIKHSPRTLNWTNEVEGKI